MDAHKAGKGKATCRIMGPNGDLLEAEVVENRDETFDIYYTATEPGPYEIDIYFGGERVPQSPYHVTVSVTLQFGFSRCYC